MTRRGQGEPLDGGLSLDDLAQIRAAIFAAPLRTALVVLTVALGFLAWNQSAAPVYRTHATVRVDDVRERDRQVDHRGIPTGITHEGEALSVLQSRALLAEVVTDLELTTWLTNEDASPLASALRRLLHGASDEFELRASLAPHASSDLRTARVRFLSEARVALTAEDGATRQLDVKSGRPFDAFGHQLTLEWTGRPDNRSFLIEGLDVDQAVDRVRQRVRIDRQQHQTGTLAVTVTDSDPRRAAAIADGVTSAFARTDIEQTRSRAEETTRFLEIELELRRDALAELEATRSEMLQSSPDAINADAASLELAEREGKWDDLHRGLRTRRAAAERVLLAIESGADLRQALAGSASDHAPEVSSLLETLAREEDRLRAARRGSEDSGYRKTLMLKADDYTVEAQRFETRVADLREIIAAVEAGDDAALARLGGDLAREGSIAVDWSMRLWMTELERTRSEIETLSAEFTDAYPPLAAARERAEHYRGEIVGGLRQLMQGQAATLEQKQLYATFWRDLFDRYPDAESALISASMVQIRGELVAAVRSEIEGLRFEEESAEREHQRVRERLVSLAAAEERLARTRLERRELQTVVGDLMRDAENARIASAGIQPSVRVLDTATVPRRALKPRASLGLAAGLLLGLIAAAAWTWVDLQRRGFGGADLAGEARGLTSGPTPVLARVGVTGPHGSNRGSPWLPRLVSGRSRGPSGLPWLPLMAAPESPAAMSYRTLRARLRHAADQRGREFRTIGVTAARSGEGTSTVAAGLAMARARLGERVLLIDAHLESPSLRRALQSAGLSVESMFGDDTRGALAVRTRPNALDVQARGLGDCLDATAQWPEVTMPSGFPTLDLLDTGSSFVVSTDLFASRLFERFCQQVSKAYDLVVLDLPALTESPDAEAAAPALDGLLVVESEARSAGPRAVAEAVERLRRAGGEVLGIVRAAEMERRTVERHAPPRSGAA